MKTGTILVLMAFITGCGIQVSKAYLDAADRLCEPNGGVLFHLIEPTKSNKVKCKNNATFTEHIIGNEVKK
jgi:hypothetical protein